MDAVGFYLHKQLKTLRQSRTSQNLNVTFDSILFTQMKVVIDLTNIICLQCVQYTLHSLPLC